MIASLRVIVRTWTSTPTCFCDGCHGVLDVPLRNNRRRLEDVWEIPESVVISHHEVSFRGLCPKCAAAGKKESSTKEKK